MTHSEMDDLYELFVLGVLEQDEAAEIEEHLQDGCAYCQARVQAAKELMGVFATVVEPVPLPKNLRARVLSSVSVKSDKKWFAGALSLGAACAALLVFCILLSNQLGEMRSQLGAVVRERDELQAALKVLSRSETRTIQFGRVNQPQGRVFINRSGGLVFAASRLPRLQNSRTYELWLVPPSGAARPAGLFQADSNNDAVRISSVQVDPATTAAVAVSVEPEGGSPAPTTTPVIVIPLS